MFSPRTRVIWYLICGRMLESVLPLYPSTALIMQPNIKRLSCRGKICSMIGEVPSFARGSAVKALHGANRMLLSESQGANGSALSLSIQNRLNSTLDQPTSSKEYKYWYDP